jgi:glutamate-1-semialdehyde 2,1-aminomutase
MSESNGFKDGYPRITRSDEYYARAVGLIPSATQTLAKGPGQYVKGVAPKYAERGQGSHIWDVDGNEYIDYSMAVGPLSLGYCYPAVDQAIKDQLSRGITFSLMSPLEVEVAELIQDSVPQAEMVRFSKTGCDVTSAAIRLARAYTNRDRVLCCGYHGWHDWYISVTSRSDGIPKATRELTSTFDYNDIDSLLSSMDEETACVILEPVVLDPPKDNFLKRVREACDRNGSLLIFDEMWTGFRLAVGGAQEYFGVEADLACYSKAIANGMPLSVLAGRREVMELLENDVFFYTTFGGEALSLAAAKATIGELRAKQVPRYLANIGKQLKDGYNELAEELGLPYTRCSGMDCRTIVTFDASAGEPLELKSLLQQEMIRRGVLWNGFHNVSYSHREEDVDHTLAAYHEALQILKRAVDERNVRNCVRGELVEPVFRKTDNFNSKPRRKASDASRSH